MNTLPMLVPKLGRPVKLDDDRAAKLLDYIRGGNTVPTSCRAAGIGYSTHRRWMIRGESDLPEDAPFKSYLQAVGIALGEAETKLVGIIEKAATDGDVRAAMWLVERRNPRG